jgi:hypothetical protein
MSYVNKVFEKIRHIGHLEKPPEDCHKPFFPVDDELSKGLKAPIQPQYLTVHSVFVARLVLDLHKILGFRTADAYEQLQKRGAEAETALGIPYNKWNPFGSWRYGQCALSSDALTKMWGTTHARNYANSVSSMIRAVVKHNKLVTCKQLPQIPKEEGYEHVETAEYPSIAKKICKGTGIKLQKIFSSKDVTFLYNHNPVYCGLELLRISLGTEKVGVDFSNTFLSLVTVAHLYNALQQMQLLQGCWDSLEHVMNTHIGSLFNGSLPTTGKQILTRIFLCFKCPASAFASDRRRKEPSWESILKNSGIILRHTGISAPLQRYVDGTDSAKKLLFNVNKELSGSRSAMKRGLTYLEMLKEFRDSMPKNVSRLSLTLLL